MPKNVNTLIKVLTFLALHKNSEKQVNRESSIVNREAGSRNRLTLSGFRRLTIDDSPSLLFEFLCKADIS
jgi:hypothetical protein